MKVLSIVLWVLAGIVGGYALSAAWSAALALVLWRLAGWDRAEATLLCAMLGFAVYLAALLWALTLPRPGRLALVLGGGAALGWGLSRWLSPGGVALALSLPAHVAG